MKSLESDRTRRSGDAPAAAPAAPAPAPMPRLLRKARAAPAPAEVEPAEPMSWDFGGAVNAGLVQRAAEGGVVDPSAVIPGGGGGASLPATLRRKFERSTGTDLSSVRVHTGGESARSASQLAARAYAFGTDIHFGAGQYDPSSRDGQLLIAHEVAHTVQHLGGTVARMPLRRATVSEPGDACEVEADQMAEAMLAGRPAGAATASSALHRFVDPARALWARDYIASAPPEVMPTVIQQIRAARGTTAPAASGVAIHLTLGDGSMGYPVQSGSILYEDLDDLLHEAQAHARPSNPYAPVPAQHTDHPNPTPPGHPMPSTTDREPQQTLPPRSTGIEGTPDQARLDSLVSITRAELERWRSYRGTMSGNAPGQPAFHAAWESPERRVGVDPAVVHYLQRAIGMDNVNLIHEMTSVNWTRGSQVLAEMFGTTANAYVHTTYRMRIQGSTATVTYENEYGMHYSHQFHLRQRMFRSTGRSHDGDDVVLTGEIHDPVFHEPHFFTGPYVVARAQAGGPNQLLVMMQYINGPEFGLTATGDTAGLQLAVGAGWSSDDGHHETHVDPPPPGHQPAAEPAGEALIYRADVYFDTGSSSIPSGGNSALQATIQHIDQFRTTHPDSPIEVHLTGFSSPRWQGARNDAQADHNNQQLSDQRVSAVQAQLENAERSHAGGGTCDFRNRTCAAPTEVLIDHADPPVADGSAQPRDGGVARTEDPPEWRRVEILVYGRQYREGQVQNQPSAPAPAP